MRACGGAGVPVRRNTAPTTPTAPARIWGPQQHTGRSSVYTLTQLNIIIIVQLVLYDIQRRRSARNQRHFGVVIVLSAASLLLGNYKCKFWQIWKKTQINCICTRHAHAKLVSSSTSSNHHRKWYIAKNYKSSSANAVIIFLSDAMLVRSQVYHTECPPGEGNHAVNSSHGEFVTCDEFTFR